MKLKLNMKLMEKAIFILIALTVVFNKYPNNGEEEKSD